MSDRKLPGWVKAPSNVTWLVTATVVVQVLTVVVYVQEPPNRLAVGILQAVALGTGVVASGLFGRGSVHQAAKSLVEPQALKAMRRSRALYQSLEAHKKTLGSAIRRLGDESRTDGEGKLVVDYLLAEAIVTNSRDRIIEHAVQAANGINDWVDLAPDAAYRLARETADEWRAEGFSDED